MISEYTSISGNIFFNGKMRSGTISFDGGTIEFKEGTPSGSATIGTLIPAPINSHTHIGDSFVREEPSGNLAEVVGPGGFKERQYRSHGPEEIKGGILATMELMRLRGTASFIDFREGGPQGSQLLKESGNLPLPVILGRPWEESDRTLDVADGAGMSSISDHDIEFLNKVAEKCHRLGKIFAIHVSEDHREDIDTILSMKPDLLIHCLECTDKDLKSISEEGVPVVITPRSNIFFGKRPDYQKFLKRGISTFIGTDNVMTVVPDVLLEVEFLYLWQRSMTYMSPELILSMATEWPRKFLKRHHITGIEDKFLFFGGARLSAYEIVSRSAMHDSAVVRLVP